MSLINNLFLLFCKMNVKSTVCNKRVQLRVKLKSLRMEVLLLRASLCHSVCLRLHSRTSCTGLTLCSWLYFSFDSLSSFFRFPIPCHKNGTHIGQGQVYLEIMKPYPNLAHFWFYRIICSYIISSICCRCKYRVALQAQLHPSHRITSTLAKKKMQVPSTE